MLEFIESPLFSKYVGDVLSEDELADLQWFLTLYPDAGDLIPGSGGCRKVRWGSGDKGKRGGSRTIYYSQAARGRIWLLLIYAKSAQANVPARVIFELRTKLVDR